MSAALSGSDDASGDPQDQPPSGETQTAYSERHGDPRLLRQRLEQRRKDTERDARMQRNAAAAREKAKRQQADRAAKQRRAGACVVGVILLGLVFWPGFELFSSTSLTRAAGGRAGDGGGGGGQESGAGLSANQYIPCRCYVAADIIFLTV